MIAIIIVIIAAVIAFLGLLSPEATQGQDLVSFILASNPAQCLSCGRRPIRVY